MSRKRKQRSGQPANSAKQLKQAAERREMFQRGCNQVSDHQIFGPLFHHIHLIDEQTYYQTTNLCPAGGMAIVSADGYIYANPARLYQPQEWAYVLAHCLLHLAFNHFRDPRRVDAKIWNVACDLSIARFLSEVKFGSPPPFLGDPLHSLNLAGIPLRSEEQLYDELCIRGIPPTLFPTGVAGGEECDMILVPEKKSSREVDWQECFSQGLQIAVSHAVSRASGADLHQFAYREGRAHNAKNWFITRFPLLGALAASFKIIEDWEICNRMRIRVAAVDMQAREIYINPTAGLDEQELRFVMAHELLHVGLRHDVRCRGRDPYLWNVACDYVINAWLIEMGVGTMPAIGGLYDPSLKGESAEAIYDRIARDLRRYRKLMTMRGYGASDILSETGWWASEDGVELDDFYRRCLNQGLELHEQQGRGYLPAGLIEEIRALSQPAIPWDVELAQWFEYHFRPLEKVRTYARASRRQSSTPDIPRPAWVAPQQKSEGRTFGVLLDTSGSMSSAVLAKALGSIASYSIAHEVPAARVVFCDAVTYDQGYMPPELIADRVKVRGRGGTILQPGIDLLESADNFPQDGPLLIITDGLCDRLRIRREHAFLMPAGRTLPFSPKGPVFKVK